MALDAEESRNAERDSGERLAGISSVVEKVVARRGGLVVVAALSGDLMWDSLLGLILRGLEDRCRDRRSET